MSLDTLTVLLNFFCNPVYPYLFKYFFQKYISISLDTVTTQFLKKKLMMTSWFGRKVEWYCRCVRRYRWKLLKMSIFINNFFTCLIFLIIYLFILFIYKKTPNLINQEQLRKNIFFNLILKLPNKNFHVSK